MKVQPIWKTKTFWVSVCGAIGAFGAFLGGKMDLATFISTIGGLAGLSTIRHGMKK